MRERGGGGGERENWPKTNPLTYTPSIVLVRRVVEARRLTANENAANRTAALPMSNANLSGTHTYSEKHDSDEPRQSFWSKLKCW